MSKRHHATRRRAYGRRQHDLHQRQDLAPLSTWRELTGARTEGRSEPAGPHVAAPDTARLPADRPHHARPQADRPQIEPGAGGDLGRTGVAFGFND